MTHGQDALLRIRNASIGTLLLDLSNDVNLEDAVKKFEAMVAPQNYKRTTALVTKAMIEKAKSTVMELGLLDSLERRFATIDDISINNLVFVDRQPVKLTQSNPFDDLSDKVVEKVKNFDKVEEISITDFLDKVVPSATSLEILVENQHSSNLVSLIAPVHAESPTMFMWDNGISWSYNGDVTDSIKEKVKQAGGEIVGDLCCRLAWDYHDDLDFHMYEPTGYHIQFTNKRKESPNGGILDIDANGSDGIKDEPVENIYYKDSKKMSEGSYKLKVHNYTKRQGGTGFTVEIEHGSETTTVKYDKVLRSGDTVDVAEIEFKGGQFRVTSTLQSESGSSKVLWDVPTMSFCKVKAVMLSPNHWGETTIGLKHYFFMLDGCKNSGKVRGFYNEFLKSNLRDHRKVLEIVGSDTKFEAGKEQLSGLGFSNEQRNSFLCRVKGSFTRVVKVII